MLVGFGVLSLLVIAVFHYGLCIIIEPGGYINDQPSSRTHHDGTGNRV